MPTPQSPYTMIGYNSHLPQDSEDMGGGNLFNGRGGSKKRNYKPTRKVRNSRSRTRSRSRMSRRNK